ncbi:MAG TPA: fused MFS/spermidine synthase [Polyangia bacterium]|nr:fused MFS/spermidine synthase [Polyangia bacterium]
MLAKRNPFLVLFFFSGFTSLVYELVFHKLLGYVFGASTLAVTTVLVAFMGGLAIGGRLFGGVADRTERPIGLYARLELLIGVYVLFVPALLRLATRVYVALGVSADVRNVGHTAVRFALSVAILVVPTVLMGGTLPLLVRALVRERSTTERQISALYGVNTLGAAAGTLAANYLLLRFLGIYGTLALGALGNLIIFARGRRLSRESEPALAVSSPAPAPIPAAQEPVSFRLALVAVFVTGFLSFLFEIVWTHLLACIVGQSVYAFGLMLFTFLLGIALGSLYLVPRLLAQGSRLGALARLLLGLGVFVLVTIPLWDKLPYVFTAALVLRPGFYARELVRALVCVAMLLPPCLALGAAFPLLVSASAHDLRRLGRGVGTLYAVNTVGCIVGAIATGFQLLERFGSRRLLLFGALASAALGLAFLRRAAASTTTRKRVLAGVAAFAAAALLMPTWDLRALASGRSLYFDRGFGVRDVLFSAEDAEGGFTTVTADENGDTVLRTNGKSQGDDHGALDAQQGMALVPTLFAEKLGDALQIGYGTGATAGALSRFPFRHIDVAEMSPGVVEAATKFFRPINFGVLDDPRVELHLNDGRNHLLLSSRRYDVISVSISTITFAGAASVFGTQFYELCKARLAPGGVFQQWIQLHHIDRTDLLVAFNTLRQVFPYVSLWVRSGHGLLIGTTRPQVVDYRRVEQMNATAAAAPLKDQLPAPDFFMLLADQALDPKAVDGALRELRDDFGDRVGDALLPHLVSSDYFPYLEYATPLGSVLSDAQLANERWLELADRGALPPLVNVPDERARRRVLVLVAYRRRRFDRALRLLEGMNLDGDPVLEHVRASSARGVAATDY